MGPLAHGPSDASGTKAFEIGGSRSPFALLLTLLLGFRYQRQGKSRAFEIPTLVVFTISGLPNTFGLEVIHKPFSLDIGKLSCESFI